MKICVIIPVYNNCKTISEVVHRCRAMAEPDVFVVSDGSTDGSDILAEEAGAKIVRHPENTGKGAAIVSGLKEASELDYTHAVLVDADGQHIPEEIPRLMDAAWEDPGKFWIGVRRAPNNGMPAASLRGRSISNFWTTLNGWQRCKDTQSGFRIYPIEETLALGCKETGFTYEMEVLVRAGWAGHLIGHVDVDVFYPEKEQRVSFFDPKIDNIRFSWLSFKMFWGMVVRSPKLLWRKVASF